MNSASQLMLSPISASTMASRDALASQFGRALDPVPSAHCDGLRVVGGETCSSAKRAAFDHQFLGIASSRAS